MRRIKQKRRLGNVGYRNSRRRGEHLEPRLALDARVVISEIVASNEYGLEDEEGDRSDWIELHNAGDVAANLNGWHLTDDASRPAKWTLPSVTIAPQDYLVVFASGKDRRDPSRNLHTNFRLNVDGEYLGLISPDAAQSGFELTPQFPELMSDRSWGIPQDTAEKTIAASTAGVRVLVPSDENGGSSLEQSWTATGYDDSMWTEASGGVGFGSVFAEYIDLDVGDQMLEHNASVFLRVPFTLENASSYYSIKLAMRYDDGFVAFLNGHEVARADAPDTLAWDSQAVKTNLNGRAIRFEEFDLLGVTDLLQEGENVLSIHGLNRSPTSSDLLFDVELHAVRPAQLNESSLRYFASPTPNRPNGLTSYAGLVAEPSVSVPRGFFDEPFTSVIRAPSLGVTLIYTTDGSLPSWENGTLVTPASPFVATESVISVSSTTTLRVAAFEEDFLSSSVNTQTYLFADDVVWQSGEGFPERWGRAAADYAMDSNVVSVEPYQTSMIEALQVIPTVSLVLPVEDMFGESGIYSNSTNTGRDWERATSVEYFDLASGEQFQVDAGLRLHGGSSRRSDITPQHSLRLHFRRDYGLPRLSFPLFDDTDVDEFNALVLDANSSDNWTSINLDTGRVAQFMRNQWAKNTTRDIGQLTAHGKFVHVYINGLYWGVYNLLERVDSAFAAQHLGGPADQYDVIVDRDGPDGARDGDNVAYGEMLRRARDGDYEGVSEMLDLDNFIDYNIVQMFTGNWDWPDHNWEAVRRRVDGEKFHFVIWDAEVGLGLDANVPGPIKPNVLDLDLTGTRADVDRAALAGGPGEIYNLLRVHPEFQLRFADRLQKHFFHDGVLTPTQAIARYEGLADEIQLALVAESARWGDVRREPPDVPDGVWQQEKDWIVQTFLPQRPAIVLEQFRAQDLYPDVTPPEFAVNGQLQHGGQIQLGDSLAFAAGGGTIYYSLDGTDPREAGGAVATSAEEFTGESISLVGYTEVKARLRDELGRWSALAAAKFNVGAWPLRISEVMYHPRDPASGEMGEGDDFEFVEIVNTSETHEVDLKGFAIVDGIEFVFPSRSLGPGKRTVVVRNNQAFQQRYGDEINVAGAYGETAADPRLSNAGETLRLVDPQGELIHEFTYDDDWIPATDGLGYSLTVVDLEGDLIEWNQANGWRASLASNGSPGRDDDADFDLDGQLNVADIDLFCTGKQNQDLQFDLTADDVVDQRDLSYLVEELFGKTFGDADLNGTFDSEDLTRVLANGEYEDQLPGNSTWAEGDWNCDGNFDSDDVITALAAGRYRSALGVAGLKSYD